MPAEVSSGRSEEAVLSSTQAESAGSAAAAMFSTGAEPPMAAGSKVEVRIVSTFFTSEDFTVWIALPA
ncbi:hypothetical protein GALL_541480 [mine drainage metagenome]|uniref:Uncharacterized protein n=1 Tax=mine drainage metagenome TaxID=410659 RepID=A0A1J5NZN5_9ZZZZ